MRKPADLKKGDKVAIVSTARKINEDEIKEAILQLQAWGLEVLLGKTIGLEHHQFAGTDEARAKDFQDMLDDKEVKAIICARGGYGTVRIMDFLDFTSFTNNPKWVVGYSDVTILHAHINNYLGIQTIHATMPINYSSNSKESLSTLHEALFGGFEEITFSSNPANKEGTVNGMIIGGNLSILYSILGTKSGFNPDHKILFIEDLDEYLYHVDRMMMALKRAGKLSGLKALIVGGMTKMNDNAIPFGKTAIEIIQEHCKAYNYPICFDAPIGHLDDNRALIFGKEIKLEVGKELVSIN